MVIKSQFINIPYQVALLLIIIGYSIASIICSFLIEVNIYNVIDGKDVLMESYLVLEALNDITNYIPSVFFIIQTILIVVTLVLKKNKTELFKNILVYVSIVIAIVDLVCLISSNGVIINNVDVIYKKSNSIGKLVSLTLQVTAIIGMIIYKFIDKKESENVIG